MNNFDHRPAYSGCVPEDPMHYLDLIVAHHSVFDFKQAEAVVKACRVERGAVFLESRSIMVLYYIGQIREEKEDPMELEKLMLRVISKVSDEQDLAYERKKKKR